MNPILNHSLEDRYAEHMRHADMVYSGYTILRARTVLSGLEGQSVKLALSLLVQASYTAVLCPN